MLTDDPFPKKLAKAALTTLVTVTVTQAVTWAFEELKKLTRPKK